MPSVWGGAHVVRVLYRNGGTVPLGNGVTLLETTANGDGGESSLHVSTGVRMLLLNSNSQGSASSTCRVVSAVTMNHLALGSWEFHTGFPRPGCTSLFFPCYYGLSLLLRSFQWASWGFWYHLGTTLSPLYSGSHAIQTLKGAPSCTRGVRSTALPCSSAVQWCISSSALDALSWPPCHSGFTASTLIVSVAVITMLHFRGVWSNIMSTLELSLEDRPPARMKTVTRRGWETLGSQFSTVACCLQDDEQFTYFH